jgi:hypothetical protein
MEYRTIAKPECVCDHENHTSMDQPLPTPLPCVCLTQRVGFEKNAFFTVSQGKCKYMLPGPVGLSDQERECGKPAVLGKDETALPACELHKDTYESVYQALGKPERVPLMRMFGVRVDEE